MRNLSFAINRLLVGRWMFALVLVTIAIIVFAKPRGKRSIPLSEIIATSSQAKMKHFNEVFTNNAPTGEFYQRTLHSNITRPSNVFLVVAAVDSDAIGASIDVFFGGRSADTPAPIERPNPGLGSHWLVAYLGAGPSGPTWFVVEKVSVSANKISLIFSNPEAGSVTADVHHYYFWVPLGKLNPGIYRLELYDAELNAVTLSRRVEIKQEKPPRRPSRRKR